ncbi:MAG: class E sortase, partial [Pseudonocardiales bacterium]|nr:class E sortase [Pseudonocardiales bacterium]
MNRHPAARRRSGEPDLEAAHLVTSRVPSGGFRREFPLISRPWPGADPTGPPAAVAVLEGGPRVRERPAHGVARHRPPVADAVSGRSARFRLAAQVLGIVAVLALSFLLELTLLGNLRHDHDQAQLASEFRSELANAVAPVGPLDQASKPWAAGTPVALLEIPRLGVREVVVEGTSSGTLMSGPGHRRDTPFPGQVGTSVIAGRRATYGAPFRSIGQLRAGDRVTVTTGQGRSSFVVLGVRHAGDPVPPALASGHGRLTL